MFFGTRQRSSFKKGDLLIYKDHDINMKKPLLGLVVKCNTLDFDPSFRSYEIYWLHVNEIQFHSFNVIHDLYQVLSQVDNEV